MLKTTLLTILLMLFIGCKSANPHPCNNPVSVVNDSLNLGHGVLEYNDPERRVNFETEFMTWSGISHQEMPIRLKGKLPQSLRDFFSNSLEPNTAQLGISNRFVLEAHSFYSDGEKKLAKKDLEPYLKKNGFVEFDSLIQSKKLECYRHTPGDACNLTIEISVTYKNKSKTNVEYIGLRIISGKRGYILCL